MVLKNSSGSVRNFNILFKVEKNKNVYLVYQDVITKKIYGSKMVKDQMLVLNEEESILVNNILERIRG